MRRQALIIGLGQFGMSLARSMTNRRFDVLAIDRDHDRVEEAGAFAAEAVTFDATDEESLAGAAPEARDLCVCAIGDESREGAILCTALLRQMGARHIVSRATDDLQERILRLVGAHEVIRPERAFGERLANRLAYREVVEEVPLGEGLVVTELRPPQQLVGRTLQQAALPRRFGVSVLAVRRAAGKPGEVVLPSPDQPLQEQDILLVTSRPGAVAELLEHLR